MGKEKMASKISEAVKKMVTRTEETPITLGWKDKSMGKSGGTEEKSDSSEKKEIEVRASGKNVNKWQGETIFMDIKSSEGSVKKTRFLMKTLINAKSYQSSIKMSKVLKVKS
jgi:hypothetical protein